MTHEVGGGAGEEGHTQSREVKRGLEEGASDENYVDDTDFGDRKKRGRRQMACARGAVDVS